MASYVNITKNNATEGPIEVPTERDGTLLLSSVSAQFPSTAGLRFKTESGAWRGLRIEGNIINPPPEGWGNTEYQVVIGKRAALKRTTENGSGPESKLKKMTEKDILSDIIVQALPYSITETQLRTHFQKFGDMDCCEIKYDKDGRSKGYGFLRYKTVEGAEAAFDGTHIFNGRKYYLQYSKRTLVQGGYEKEQPPKDVRTKLFVGHLPPSAVEDDLNDHFSKYGVLKDVYIPTPCRGYGFVEFSSQAIADKVLDETHVIRGTYLNVKYPNETEGKRPNPSNHASAAPPPPRHAHAQGSLLGALNTWLTYPNYQTPNTGSNRY